MKLFISWSGDISRKIAKVLHDWIPSVLQNVVPYMSAENIDKGERWSVDIAGQLQDTQFGIICLTPDNINAPWVLFESGALSKSIQHSRVAPITFGLSPSDLSRSPLLQFQITQFNKDDMHRLIVSLNNSAPDAERIGQDLATRSFIRAWSELEESVNPVLASQNLPSQPETSSIHTTSDSLSIVLEEILSNTRLQIKMLNSPSDLLPSKYLTGALREANMISSPLRHHSIWSEIDDSIKEIAIFFDLITTQLIRVDIMVDSAADTEEEIVKSALAAFKKLRYTVDYVKRRIYRGGGPEISRLRPPVIRPIDKE